jgi:hypothetical protein
MLHNGNFNKALECIVVQALMKPWWCYGIHINGLEIVVLLHFKWDVEDYSSQPRPNDLFSSIEPDYGKAFVKMDPSM